MPDSALELKGFGMQIWDLQQGCSKLGDTVRRIKQQLECYKLNNK